MLVQVRCKKVSRVLASTDCMSESHPLSRELNSELAADRPFPIARAAGLTLGMLAGTLIVTGWWRNLATALGVRGLESSSEPEYQVIEREGKFEIRSYPAREQSPSRTIASMRFTGRVSDEMLEHYADHLSDWVHRKGYDEASDAALTSTDPPRTLAPFRRHEVHIEVHLH